MSDVPVENSGVKVMKVKKSSESVSISDETVNQNISELENKEETVPVNNDQIYEASRDIPAHVGLDLLTNALESSKKGLPENTENDVIPESNTTPTRGFGKEFNKFISNYITVSITLPLILNLSGFLLLFIMSKIFSMFIVDLTVSWLLLTFTFSIFATKMFTFCYGLIGIIKVLFNKDVVLQGKLAQMVITVSSLLYPLLALIGLMISWFIFGNLINMTVLTDVPTYIEPTNFETVLNIFRHSSYSDLMDALTKFLQTMGYTR